MNSRRNTRAWILLGTAMCAVAAIPVTALAQSTDSDGLQEIIVTAQKREQRVLDVPVAVSALSEGTLEANRVTNVTDLSGLAPGVTVRTSAGGSQLPSFTIRGAVSYGVVPGSDKEVSMYLDGVYLSSPRGTVFELPDTQRIEVLRGPQGTLFGRNATAGAVSITTRDPVGEMGAKADFTIGNYDQRRMRVSVNSSQIGPFSGYFTFLHNERRGDIRNANAGQLWDRSLSPSGLGIAKSPKYLGSHNSDSYFAAIKFEPSDLFTTTYKFDYFKDDATPEGTGFIGYDPTYPLIGDLIGALVNNQPFEVHTYPEGKRPKVVNNAFAVPTKQKNYGHNVTSTLLASDNLTFKNILAYRHSYVFAASSIDGISSLPFTAQAIGPYATLAVFTNPAFASLTTAQKIALIPTVAAQVAPLVGQPFTVIATAPESVSSQWSDELQANYTFDLVTLTVGAMWFHSKDRSGGPRDMQNTFSFTAFPGGVIPLGRQGRSDNYATSLAAYAQAEFHVSSTLDLVAGGRVTKDHKYGNFSFNDPNAGETLQVVPFNYRKTKPNFLVGMNYKPNQDILIYGKYSTAFVSGGNVAGLSFKPESAKSFEGGIKASLLNNHVQTSLAVYTVTYHNVQTAQAGNTFGQLIDDVVGIPGFHNLIGTFIYPQGGPVKNSGFEFEGTARPFEQVTMGGSLAYADTKFKDVDPVLIAANLGDYVPTLRPKWTASIWGQFEQPLAGDTTFTLRADASWRSRMAMVGNPAYAEATTPFQSIAYAPSTWIVNTRASIRNIDLGGVHTTLSLWAKNLTNDRSRTFQLLNAGFEASANYQPARTYGLDLSIEY